MAGRAGRSELKGEVYIQTHEPEHPLFGFIQNMDRDGFMKMELSQRKIWGDPPFSRQIAFIVSGKNEQEVHYAAAKLRQAFPEGHNAEVLGPAPAPMAKLRDRYRDRLLVKGSGNLHKVVQLWLSSAQIPKSVRVTVDVDPISFF